MLLLLVRLRYLDDSHAIVYIEKMSVTSHSFLCPPLP